MKPKKDIFKAYDIRGIYQQEFDQESAYMIGQAYAKFIKPKKVAVGRDVRNSGIEIKKQLIKGLTDAGVDVVDVGTISTDMLYFAVANYDYDGGITVSASHNPREFNGFKLVREKSIAISSDTGLNEIRDLVLNDNYKTNSDKKGQIQKKDILKDYIKCLLSFVDIKKIKSLKIVLSANFGLAGIVAKELIKNMPVKINYVCLDCNPDGNFPKGRPDPLIPERQKETSELVKKEKADFAVHWDADADRCFFYDENGNFIEGYYIVGLLAKELLKNHPQEKILYDPRLTWATIETVKKAGGIPIVTKAGHTFIKDRMKKEDALFAGEMSAHYYFRDYWYADNGMIPFLMVMEIISKTGMKLSKLIKDMTEKYFVSGEINTQMGSAQEINKVLTKIEKKYSDGEIEHIDGLSVTYKNWRFNLRPSNTEPKLRLNVEALDKKTMQEKTKKLLNELK